MKKAVTYLPYVLLAGAIAAMMLLLSQITLYSDDYYYSTFFYDGIAGFWAKTVDHYRTFNGRALVHFLAQVFLIFKTKLYAVVFPFVMAAAFYFARRVQCPDGAKFSPAAVALALGIFLALPVEYLNQSLCWISGSFNYCFPALLVFAYLLFQKRAVSGNCLAAACVLGFLAGATTEQNGFAALAVGFLTVLCACLRGRRLWRGALPLCFVLAGYATVLLAPGTSNRIAVEGGLDLLSILLHPTVLVEYFTEIMRCFTGADSQSPSAALLILAVMLLLACLPLIRRKKLLRPLFLGIPAAAAYGIALCMGHATVAALTVCLYLVLAGILLLFDREWETSGVLLLGSLASIGIMVFTALGTYRTVVPTLIFLIAVTVRLGEEYLAFAADRISKGGKALLPVSAALALAVCAIVSLPTFIGYRQNHAVHVRNEAAIRGGIGTGEIVLCSDVTDLHRHTLMYEDGYFYTQFCASYRIPAGTVVHVEGKHYAHFPIFVGDRDIERHAIMTNGVLCVPMVQIFEAFGGSCAWDWDTHGGYFLTMGGTEYYLSKKDWCIRKTDTGEIVTEEAYTYSNTDHDYIEIGAFAAFMDMQYEFDGETVRFPAAENLNETD